MTTQISPIEGSYALHLFHTIDWEKWQQTTDEIRLRALNEFHQLLDKWEILEKKKQGSYGVFTIVGQKADLLLMLLQPTMEQLMQAENDWNQSALAQFTNPVYSFVSVIEKSIFQKQNQQRKMDEMQKEKLHPTIPKHTYICFYPMSKNKSDWYTLTADKQKDMMLNHVQTVKSYDDKIKRIITGAIGLDNFEWGVSLFANEPILFKQMLYDSKFDEVHAKYTTYGSFYVGKYVAKHEINPFFHQ